MTEPEFLTASGDPPRAIAHRAANHLDRMLEAEEAGADLLEADVWLYRGRLEVRHEKTMGPVPLLWDRWSLAPAWQPRLLLAEIMCAAAPGTQLMFDLKGRDPRLPGALREMAAALWPGRSYSVCARHWPLLAPFGGDPAVEVAHSAGTARELRDLAAVLDGKGHHMVSLHRKLLDQETVGTLKKRAATVITWPINDREHLREVLAYGVDGFTSDSITLVREVVAARG